MNKCVKMLALVVSISLLNGCSFVDKKDSGDRSGQESVMSNDEYQAMLDLENKEAEMIFEQFIGYYECPDDEEVYVRLFYDNSEDSSGDDKSGKGIRTLEFTWRTTDGEVQKESICVQYAEIRNSTVYFGKWIIRGEGYFCQYDFEFDEEKRMLSRFGVDYVWVNEDGDPI